MRWIRRIAYSALCSSIVISGAQAGTGSSIPDVVVTPQTSSNTQPYGLVPVQTLSQAEITQSGARTVTDVLKTQSDIQLQELYDGSLAVPSMRGFGDNTSENVLILVNGMPLTNPDLGSVMLNAVPLDDIDRINIYSGSAGVLYGDQAVGGVIDIITKRYQADQYQVGATVGSYDLNQLETSMNHNWDNGVSLHISAQNLNSDNYRDHNNETRSNLQLGVGYQYTAGSVFVQYDYLKNDLEYPGALTAEQVDQNPQQAQNDTDYDNQTHNNFLLQWENSINAQWSFQNGLAIQNMQGKGVLTTAFTEERNFVEWTPRFLGSFVWGDRSIQSKNGLVIQDASYSLDGAGYYSDSKQKKQALFSALTIPLIAKMDLSVGGRAAESQVDLLSGAVQSNATNDAAIFDIGVGWKPKNDLNVYARRAGNYRFPKAEENALTSDNKPLKTQTGISYETGLKWKPGKQQLDVNLYQLNLSNEIMYVPNLSGLFGANENLSPTRRVGGGVKFTTPLMRYWDASASYSYVDARFREGPDEGKRIPFVAANKAKLGSTYHFSDHWLLHAEAVLISDRYASGDVDNTGALLGGYTVYNLSVTYRFSIGSISATINNLTNVYYSNYAQLLGSTVYYYPAPDRNFWLKASFTL